MPRVFGSLARKSAIGTLAASLFESEPYTKIEPTPTRTSSTTLAVQRDTGTTSPTTTTRTTTSKLATTTTRTATATTNVLPTRDVATQQLKQQIALQPIQRQVPPGVDPEAAAAAAAAQAAQAASAPAKKVPWLPILLFGLGGAGLYAVTRKKE